MNSPTTRAVNELQHAAAGPAPQSHPTPRRAGGRLVPWLLFVFGLVYWVGFLYIVVPPPRPIREYPFLASGQEHDLFSMLRTPEKLLKRPNFGMEDGVYISDGWFIHERKLTALQQAVRTRQLPYHLPGLSGYELMPSRTSPVGDRLFAIPNGWPWSPQVLLLAVLDLPTFIIVNWLLMYTVGFIGCLLIRRRYRLGPVAFTFLILLFNGNGWIIAHMAILMADYTGYFLNPYIVLLLLRAGETAATDRRQQWRVGLWLGLVLAMVWWQGSAHPFIHWVTFMGYWGIVNWRKWRVAVVSLVSAFAVAAFRLIPPAMSWGLARRYHVDNPAIFGFWGLDEYVDGLAVCHPFIPAETWELHNLYVSIFGLFALIYLALWAPWKGSRWVRLRPWTSLLLPAAILVVLSFRHMKAMLIPNWIPLFNAEAQTSRYMMVPLVCWIIVASVNLQGAMEQFWRQRRMRLLIVGGLGLIAALLLNHARLWRIWLVSEHAQWSGFQNPTLPVQLTTNLTDTGYLMAVNLSLVVSCIALLVVGGMLIAQRAAQSRLST